MKPHVEIDKNTNVAFLDAVEAAPNAKIRMMPVSDQLGFRSQVVARVDIENNVFLGLVIEDYKAFRREIRMKYFAWRVEQIMVLLLCTVRGIVNQESAHDRQHRLASV